MMSHPTGLVVLTVILIKHLWFDSNVMAYYLLPLRRAQFGHYITCVIICFATNVLSVKQTSHSKRFTST